MAVVVAGVRGGLPSPRNHHPPPPHEHAPWTPPALPFLGLPPAAFPPINPNPFAHSGATPPHLTCRYDPPLSPLPKCPRLPPLRYRCGSGFGCALTLSPRGYTV
jgi:hypothetical protein